jgi:ABC-type branched-subunit amino acid transport system ATPase component
MSILDVRNVKSGHGKVQILWGANMAFEEGKLTCGHGVRP